MDRRQLEERVRAMYDAFAARDQDAYSAALADAIVWHVPGANPVSGAYHGRDEYLGSMVQRMGPLDEWTVTVQRVLANERASTVLVAFHLVGTRRGRHVDMDGYHLVRLDDDGRIAEGWGFTEDQDALDEFFSA